MSDLILAAGLGCIVGGAILSILDMRRLARERGEAKAGQAEACRAILFSQTLPPDEARAFLTAWIGKNTAAWPGYADFGL